jgi:hypothetical protein
MIHPWKKAYHTAMCEQDPAKQKALFTAASEALHAHALELAHEMAEMEEARRQLTIRELESNLLPI